MDGLTVILAGLIIFDGHGNVHLVRAAEHEVNVTINGQTYKAIDSLGFSGLTPGDVSPTTGFELPDLRHLFAPKPLSINASAKAVMRFRMHGGTTSPSEGYARCTVNGRSMVFWQGLKWTVNVPKNAQLVIDTKPFPIDDSMTIEISNDYTGNGNASHVHMYEDGLNEKGQLTFFTPKCDARFPPEPKSEVGKSTHNPVTCPPVSLQ